MKASTGLATLAILGLTASGCGSEGATGPAEGADDAAAQATAGTDAAWVGEPWLLRFTSAGGAEGETMQAVYIRYTPSTGATTVRKLPGLTTQDTYADGQAVLVSADQSYALLDSRVVKADRKAGRLTLFSLDGDDTLQVDVRGWSGVEGLQPVGAAFDPVEARTLRVVDSDKRVWKVDLAAQSAVPDGELPRRSGWIFANGFDKNTGLPFIESLESSDTLPAGNGDDDVRPVERRGGVIRIADGSRPDGEPALPCGFAGGFTLTDGTAWLFCADTPTISTYWLPKGADAWEKVGADSQPVVPRTVVDLPVVLPPVGTA